jgi:hypothetical protein
MKYLFLFLISLNSYSSDIKLSDEDMSANYNSDVFETTTHSGFSIHAVYTGSPNGIERVQFSNTLGACSSATNWINITDATSTITASGQNMYNFFGHYPKCVRVNYTFTSGSGTASYIIKAN